MTAMAKTVRTLAYGLLLATAGCAVGPRYRPPEIPVPSSWSEAQAKAAAPGTTADGATLERWWTAFGDPVLDDLIARAVDRNLDLQIAAARIREARAARGIAASAALPQVDAAGSYARTERSETIPPFDAATGPSAPFGPRTQDVFEAGFDATWEIDVFGGVRRDREAALAQVEATEEARRDVLVTLEADVAREYIELRASQRRIEILDATLRSETDTRDLAKARFDAGLGTELDVARAQGLVDATAAERPALERQARENIHRLGVLLGREPGTLAPELEAPGAIPSPPPAIPAALPSDLLSRRPDLRRAERELAAATARVGVATADLFPRFSISGHFGRLSDDSADLASGRSGFASIIPGVRWPIFSGGRIRANIRVQDARQEQALHQYEKAVLTALEEVENALSYHAREERRLESLRSSVDAQRLALDLATERYTGGLENFLSVLDAQRSVYAAEDAMAGSQRDIVLALVALYKSLGGGWSIGDHLDASQPQAALAASVEAR